jgi:tetratricopeptide repeat protein
VRIEHTGTWIVAVVVLLPAAAFADEVFLKSGGRVSGRVVSRTATSVEVDVGAGRIAVPASSVVRIEEGRSPLHEYEERAGRIGAADVEAWIALGEWASAQGLSAQAREAFHRALAISPTDPRANAGLGNMQVDGRWVSEDEGYRAKGYVKFEGQWLTPPEHEAILRERAVEAEHERQRRQSDQRAREAESRAQEAEARARQAEAEAKEAQATNEGIPLWYGWGAGPVVWPSGPVVTPYRRTVPRAVPR